MKKKTNTQSKNNTQYYVPDIFMKIFVYGIGVFYCISLIIGIWQYIVQFTQNPEVGGFYGYFITTLLIPLLLFLIAFLLNPRNIRIIDKCFESIMFTMVGMIACSVAIQYYPIYISNTPNYIEDYARYEITISLVFTLIYTGILLLLRTSKKWK